MALVRLCLASSWVVTITVVPLISERGLFYGKQKAQRRSCAFCFNLQLETYDGYASEHLNPLHQLILVSPGDGNLVVVNFDDELKGVNVGDTVNVDHVVPAYPNEIF